MTATNTAFKNIELNASLSMGFRPLYLLATLWAAISVCLWVFAPTHLNTPLPGMYWHAHEMLWGFVSTIAVGFLLTASATWTGINPLFGRPLGLLCLVWICSRLLFLLGPNSTLLLAGTLDSLFFLWAAVAIARSVILSKNWRNLVLPFMLLFLAATQFGFVYGAKNVNYTLMWQSFTIAWIVMAVISLLISSRVIPFFSKRRLADTTIPLLARLHPVLLGLGAVMVIALCLNQKWLAGVALIMAAFIVFYQLSRWYRVAIWQDSLLWILYVGYAFIGVGLVSAGIYFAQDALGLHVRLAVPIHIMAVAGFSIVIIGMLVRTTQGHLGMTLSTTAVSRTAFYCMIICAAARLIALWPSSVSLYALHFSTLFWVLSLGLYISQFALKLLSPRPAAAS